MVHVFIILSLYPEMLESINNLILTKGLWALFILMITNGMVSLPPSTIVLFLAGVYANVFQYNFYYVLAIVVVGNVIGSYSLFLVGRYFGYEWIFRTKYLSKFIQKEKIHKLAKKFRKEGAHWVAIFKCISGTRAIVSIPAGMIKMPHLVFLGYATLGSLIWALFWQSLGYYIGMSFLQYKLYISLTLLLLLVITLFVFRNVTHRCLKE